MSRFFAPIPNRLTILELSCVTFAVESLPRGQRHSLPCLKRLSLEEVIFLCPLRMFFHCPRLEILRYVANYDEPEEDFPIIERYKSQYRILTQQVLDEAFFQETPTMVSISLRGTTFSDDMRTTLASCPVLQDLEISDCGIRKFILPFLDNLKDKRYFPSLEKLSIDDSWPAKFNISYDEFTAQCRSKRPGTCVFGDGRRDPETFSDDDQQESGLGSDSEAEGDESGDGDSDPGHEHIH
jgi:hypothetical protein